MEAGNLKEWLRVNEFKINIALLAISAAIFVVAMLFNNGLLAGAGLLAVIFFVTYSIFAYVRVNGLGPE